MAAAGVGAHGGTGARHASRLALALGAATLPGATGIFMTYMGWQVVLAAAFKGTSAPA